MNTLDFEMTVSAIPFPFISLLYREACHNRNESSCHYFTLRYRKHGEKWCYRLRCRFFLHHLSDCVYQSLLKHTISKLPKLFFRVKEIETC